MFIRVGIFWFYDVCYVFNNSVDNILLGYLLLIVLLKYVYIVIKYVWYVKWVYFVNIFVMWI